MLTLSFIKQSYFIMTLLIILGLVFLAVALMVIVGEKFAKPMSAEDQAKFSKFVPILVFFLIIAALVKGLM